MLKKTLLRLFFTVITCFFVGLGANAQKAFENWAIGLEGGSYGGGLTLATSLSSHFILKTGFDYIGLPYPGDFNVDFNGHFEKQSEEQVDLSASIQNSKINLSHFKAVVDYYPMKNGIFALSAGLYAGGSSITANGTIKDYADIIKRHPHAEYGDLLVDISDIVIKPNSDGSLNGKIRMGNTLKPYFGISLGRTIATTNRVGFKLDLGLIYQGDYAFESDNVFSNPETIVKKATDVVDFANVPKWLLNCWPVINISLSYRL